MVFEIFYAYRTVRTGAADLACVPGVNRFSGPGASAAKAPRYSAGSGRSAGSGFSFVPCCATALSRYAGRSGVRRGAGLVGQSGSELLA
jgi:hypothetical protein